jgi:hypothetical protein
MSSSTSKSISNTNAFSSVRTSGRLHQSAGKQNRLRMQVSGLDSDRSCATRLVWLLENVLFGVRSLDGRAI